MKNAISCERRKMKALGSMFLTPPPIAQAGGFAQSVEV